MNFSFEAQILFSQTRKFFHQTNKILKMIQPDLPTEIDTIKLNFGIDIIKQQYDSIG